MNPQRRRLSFSLGLGWSAACAVLSGCYVNVVPLSGMGPDPDGGTTVDAAPVDARAPTDAAPPETTPPDASAPDAPTPDPAASGLGSVDLLLVVDDSNSMTQGQDFLSANIGSSLGALFARYGVRDLHVGVVSTDLGTAGAPIPSCAAPDGGDQGVLNPRARGAATRTRTLPSVDDNGFCNPTLDSAPFLTLRPDDDPMFRYWVPSCQARVGVGGCGLEQQLESAYRALVLHGPAGLNAGFLRPEATLAILVLSDEDDGSVRDCRYADGVGPCDDARDVYNYASTRWASEDLNLRFYDYAPGGAQDPTWSLDRYVDPARPTRGFLGLKPGHPERVVFGAVTGVPVAVPRRADGSTDWDALLGPAAAGRPDDFVARDAARAYSDPMAARGPVSMRQRDRDPQCPARMVPACRSPDVGSPTTCDPARQPFAWRARRIAEVARRFDESALCGGAPCHNGMVSSICDVNDSAPLGRFADMIGRRVSR